jgi:hypothetical protein
MPSPSPLVDELFDGLSGKKILGHFKKNIVQRNVAEKIFLQAIGGGKKILAQKNCPTPPPSNI